MIRYNDNETIFKTCEDVADFMIKYDNEKNGFTYTSEICIVAYYEYVTTILESLIKKGATINSIELCSSEIDGYFDEYVCYYTNGEVLCEKLRTEEGKVKTYVSESDYVLIHGDVKSDVVTKTDGEWSMFLVNEYDNYEFESEMNSEDSITTTNKEILDSLSKDDFEDDNIDDEIDSKEMPIKKCFNLSEGGKKIEYNYVSEDGSRKMHTSYYSSNKLSEDFISEFVNSFLNV